MGNHFDDFCNCILVLAKVVGQFNFNELLLIMKPFDLQSIEKHMKCIWSWMEKNLLNILKEYKKGHNLISNSTTNFVQTLLGLDEKLDERMIMGVLLVGVYLL